MVSIKASYQNTVRRFAIPKTITWLELESNLRTLFSFSPTFSFALSYTDEDGDIITLSSDLELQDILSQVQQTPLRFIIIPYEKHDANEKDNDRVVIDRHRLFPIPKQPTMTEEEPSFISTISSVKGKDNDRVVIDQPRLFGLPIPKQLTMTEEEPSFIPTMTEEEPSFIPTISSVKGKEKAEPSFSNPDPLIQEEQNNEEQTRPPFIDLAAQFQKVIDQLRPMMELQPQLIEQANKIMDQILNNIPVDIEVWTQWFNDKIAEAQRNFYSSANVDVTGEKQTNSTQQQFEESFFDPQNIINPLVQRVNQAAANIPSRLREWQNGQLASEEAMKEKLELLRSMGFLNDNVNKELLKKYQGNVERVVEILIEDSEYSVVDAEVQMEDLFF